MNQKFKDSHRQIVTWMNNADADAFSRLLKAKGLTQLQLLTIAIKRLAGGDFDREIEQIKTK